MLLHESIDVQLVSHYYGALVFGLSLMRKAKQAFF
jgi:hypothetical protein